MAEWTEWSVEAGAAASTMDGPPIVRGARAVDVDVDSPGPNTDAPIRGEPFS
jgi:hypothetical protein